MQSRSSLLFSFTLLLFIFVLLGIITGGHYAHKCADESIRKQKTVYVPVIPKLNQPSQYLVSNDKTVNASMKYSREESENFIVYDRLISVNESHNSHPTVIILSPMRDAAKFLGRFFRNLLNLKYPQSRISLGFLVGDSTDTTWDDLKIRASFLADDKSTYIYRRITIMKQDFGNNIDRIKRHELNVQFERRCIMARARNYLSFQAIHDEEWVLWLDSDLSNYPRDLLTKLLDTKKEVVVPNCVMKRGERSYDLNSFQNTLETEAMIKEKEKTSDDFILFEGYKEQKNKRLYLSDLRGQNIAPLDGVGGAALLIKAQLHREGLIFPPFEFQHQVETEGLAKMAKAMGVQPYGMPNLEVLHR